MMWLTTLMQPLTNGDLAAGAVAGEALCFTLAQAEIQTAGTDDFGRLSRELKTWRALR